jgi:hypothetical protein
MFTSNDQAGDFFRTKRKRHAFAVRWAFRRFVSLTENLALWRRRSASAVVDRRSFSRPSCRSTKVSRKASRDTGARMYGRSLRRARHAGNGNVTRGALLMTNGRISVTKETRDAKKFRVPGFKFQVESKFLTWNLKLETWNFKAQEDFSNNSNNLSR